jgi:hypothetical protein
MSSSKRATIVQNNPLAGLEEEVKTTLSPQPSAKPTLQKKNQPRPGHRQTTIILPTEQLKWLAETTLRSINDNGIVTNKTMVIKALIDVARSANLDLSGLESEEDIGERLIEAITRRHGNR